MSIRLTTLSPLEVINVPLRHGHEIHTLKTAFLSWTLDEDFSFLRHSSRLLEYTPELTLFMVRGVIFFGIPKIVGFLIYTCHTRECIPLDFEYRLNCSTRPRFIMSFIALIIFTLYGNRQYSSFF